MEGRMPSVVASGSRQEAFNDFCAAVKYDFIVLLVDSEGPRGKGIQPHGQHLKTRDSWNQPSGATDDQVHLMVQCMEAWFLADKDSLLLRTTETALTRTRFPPVRILRTLQKTMC